MAAIFVLPARPVLLTGDCVRRVVFRAGYSAIPEAPAVTTGPHDSIMIDAEILAPPYRPYDG